MPDCSHEGIKQALVWMLQQQVEVDSQVFEATIVGWSQEQLMQGLEAKQRQFKEYLGGSNWQEEGARIIQASQKITT